MQKHRTFIRGLFGVGSAYLQAIYLFWRIADMGVEGEGVRYREVSCFQGVWFDGDIIVYLLQTMISHLDYQPTIHNNNNKLY